MKTHSLVSTRFALAVFAMVCSTGCSLVGPASIRSGRPAYNETIIATNNQQVLAMIVRMRYGETAGLLAVSSVTANMKVASNIGSEFGFGEKTDYAGNLVPLSIGFAYEENPTISYTPVQGEAYLREFLAPLPIDLVTLLFGALRDSPRVSTLLLRSINGIQNPDFVADPSVEVDLRFARITALLAALSGQGHLTWALAAEKSPGYVLAMAGDGDAFAAHVAELYQLLGFEAPQRLDGVVSLPVQFGIGKPGQPAIRLHTRSLFDLFSLVAASVDVPQEHLESGMANALPPVGPAGQGLHIGRSRFCPGDALATTRHHGWCYAIADTDAATKLTFRMLEALVSVRIADSTKNSRSTPVLTVPVAR